MRANKSTTTKSRKMMTSADVETLIEKNTGRVSAYKTAAQLYAMRAATAPKSPATTLALLDCATRWAALTETERAQALR